MELISLAHDIKDYAVVEKMKKLSLNISVKTRRTRSLIRKTRFMQKLIENISQMPLFGVVITF